MFSLLLSVHFLLSAQTGAAWMPHNVVTRHNLVMPHNEAAPVDRILAYEPGEREYKPGDKVWVSLQRGAPLPGIVKGRTSPEPFPGMYIVHLDRDPAGDDWLAHAGQLRPRR